MSGDSRAGPPEETPAGTPSDEPPGYVVEQAKQLHSRPVTELAQLVFDSLVDADSPPENHYLRFDHPEIGVSLRVSVHPDGTRIVGRVMPVPRRVVLHIRTSDRALVAEAEEDRFDFPAVPHGLVRLSVERGPASPLIWTDWFRV